MQEGMVLKGKYSMQSHGWAGPAYVLCSAYRTAQPEQHLSVKLFARGVDFLQEKALLETPTITLQEFLPGLHLFGDRSTPTLHATSVLNAQCWLEGLTVYARHPWFKAQMQSSLVTALAGA